MFREWNERLADLRGKQRQQANWKQRFDYLKTEVERKRHERDQWAEQLRKEQRDVDRLNGISLGALFYTLIGKKQEKLSQEEAEVLQAKLKHDEAADSVNDLETELEELKRGLAELKYIDADIDYTLKEKTRAIRREHPTLSAQLQKLSDDEAVAQADVKELGEALSAGRSVVSALGRAEERLESAKNWGTYDMLGGGMIATAVKHSRIDDARSAIHDAQNRLRRFQAELQDVQRDVNVSIDISGMLTFADYFFDGLIMDWIVQGRINNSLQEVKSKLSQINRIISTLGAENRKAEQKLAELRRIQDSLIETA